MKKITIVALALLALTVGVYAQSAPIPAPTTPAPTWEYATNTDKMTGQVIRTACLKSTNQFEFNAPYSGGSNGVICFRTGDPRSGARYGEAILSITNGQFVCNVDTRLFHSPNCVLGIKFDDDSMKNIDATIWHYGNMNDRNTNVVFIEGGDYKFLFTKLKESKHMKIRAVFFQEGAQVMEFDPAGLTWEWK